MQYARSMMKEFCGRVSRKLLKLIREFVGPTHELAEGAYGRPAVKNLSKVLLKFYWPPGFWYAVVRVMAWAKANGYNEVNETELVKYMNWYMNDLNSKFMGNSKRPSEDKLIEAEKEAAVWYQNYGIYLLADGYPKAWEDSIKARLPQDPEDVREGVSILQQRS